MTRHEAELAAEYEGREIEIVRCTCPECFHEVDIIIPPRSLPWPLALGAGMSGAVTMVVIGMLFGGV